MLFLSGVPLFNSIGLAFTSLSTGGFSITDAFQFNYIQLAILCVLMVIGSISFITHNKLFRRKFKEFFSDLQIRVFLALLAISIAVTLLVYGKVRIVVFEIISSFSTTGYSITSIPVLPPLFIFVILVGMVIGGGMASTAGGVKVFRFYTMLNSIKWLFRRVAAPVHAIIPFKIDERPVEEIDRLIVHGFFFTYISILIIATVIFLLLGHGFLNSVFQVTSALGTVGLSTMALGGLHWLAKLVLIVCMLLGRLEIFPLLIAVRNGLTNLMR